MAWAFIWGVFTFSEHFYLPWAGRQTRQHVSLGVFEHSILSPYSVFYLHTFSLGILSWGLPTREDQVNRVLPCVWRQPILEEPTLTLLPTAHLACRIYRAILSIPSLICTCRFVIQLGGCLDSVRAILCSFSGLLFLAPWEAYLPCEAWRWVYMPHATWR